MARSNLAHVLDDYGCSAVALDTGPLLLFCVGCLDPDRIATFKRTRNMAFTAEDFAVLTWLVGRFRARTTTPHVLAEVGNYLDDFRLPLKAAALAVLKSAVIDVWSEESVEATRIAASSAFSRFAVTDTALFELGLASKTLVVTTDGPLAGGIQAAGGAAINFNHFRPSVVG